MNENNKKVKTVAIAISPLLLSALLLIIFTVAIIPLKNHFAPYISLISMFDGEGFEPNEESVVNIFTEIKDRDTNAEKVYASDIQYPQRGALYGKVYIEKRDIEVDLYFSDDEYYLNRGVGQNYSTYPVGFGAPYPLIAGHNNGVFNSLQYVEEGDEIKIATSYGNFIYKVYKTRICADSEFSYQELKGDKDIVVLYTCYPFSALGLTKQRFFVYAEKIAGPVIIEE